MALRSELPVNIFHVGTNGHGFQKVNRKPLRIDRRQTFEDPVFQMREPFRQTKFIFIRRMVVLIQRATNRATVAVFPACALNDLVCCMMRLEPRQVLMFYCFVAVKRFHDFSFRLM
jgi:hypothetical protein